MPVDLPKRARGAPVWHVRPGPALVDVGDDLAASLSDDPIDLARIRLVEPAGEDGLELGSLARDAERGYVNVLRTQ